MNLLHQQVPLIQTPWYPYRNVVVVRGDLLHPVVSGNKLFKLEPLLTRALAEKRMGVISVGGRYSNHLHALAYAANALGLKSVGLVSGYEQQPLTPTLKDCQRWGMTLHFIGREQYKQRNEPEFWADWQQRYIDYLEVREGGWAKESISASRQWWKGVPPDAEVVVVAVGSGTTLAGLAMSAPKDVLIVGVPTYKDPDNYQNLQKKLKGLDIPSDRYQLWTQYAGPKFGKVSAEQQRFTEEFFKIQRVRLDPVYTAKAFYALAQELAEDPILRRKNIAILHTGGLQGLRL